MPLRILLTGSSGFLGLQISKILSETLNQVVALDIKIPEKEYSNFVYETTSIDEYLKNGKNKLKDFDLIIHTASVLPFKGEEDKLYQTNVITSLNLIKEVSKLKNTFFVYISSSGIYGNPSKIPVDSSTSFNPLDLYAETKIMTERNIENYLFTENFAIIRPRTILGTNRKGIFEIFFKLIKYNIPIPLPNNGRQIIQFVEVSDLAKLILHVGEKRLHGMWAAGAPNPKPLAEHLEILAKEVNKKVFKLNISPKIFKTLGKILIRLRLINFTKWHFDAFPHDFYFDKNWKPENFDYAFSNEETFLKSAFTFFEA